MTRLRRATTDSHAGQVDLRQWRLRQAARRLITKPWRFDMDAALPAWPASPRKVFVDPLDTRQGKSMKKTLLALAAALLAQGALAQSYASQQEFDRTLGESAEDVSFLAFEGETTLGKATRCQLQYRLVRKEALAAGNAPQIVQGSVTSDYYKDRTINFILNIQPVRVDVNPSTRQARSTTVNPQFATLKINGLEIEKYKIAKVDCESGLCFAFSPTTGDEIVAMVKAVYARPVFDAEVVYAFDKAQANDSFKLSSIRANVGNNGEARKDFTSCLQEILKREIGDIEKFVGDRK
jgi:hypothetical protein